MLLQILAKVYLARSDVGYSVRSAALHVWKTLVTNTPRTLAEILPFLMESIIELLASDGNALIMPAMEGSSYYLERDVRVHVCEKVHQQ